MVTSKYNVVHSTYDRKIEKVIHVHMLRTNISYLPFGVKTQNVNVWPLRPFSHDASNLLDMNIKTTLYELDLTFFCY